MKLQHFYEMLVIDLRIKLDFSTFLRIFDNFVDITKSGDNYRSSAVAFLTSKTSPYTAAYYRKIFFGFCPSAAGKIIRQAENKKEG